MYECACMCIYMRHMQNSGSLSVKGTAQYDDGFPVSLFPSWRETRETRARKCAAPRRAWRRCNHREKLSLYYHAELTRECRETAMSQLNLKEIREFNVKRGG